MKLSKQIIKTDEGYSTFLGNVTKQMLRIQDLVEGVKKCPECDREYRKDEDLRVEAGMKCGYCAYNY